MKNMGMSIQARLKNLCVENGLDMPSTMRRYVQERLMYRLSVSSEAPNFVLKGGLLLAGYNDGSLLRPTEDIDFNGLDAGGSVDSLHEALVAVLRHPAPDDGVTFFPETMHIAKDRTGIVPGGKILLGAKLGTANVDIKIDVGFGNPVTPGSRMMEFPTILDSVVPRPVMMAYPLETVIAEKLHAMAQFGMRNTRWKDYYDVAVLSRSHGFDGDLMADAIEATFRHQQRPVPEILDGLSQEFAENSARPWESFLSKLPRQSMEGIRQVVAEIAGFVQPALDEARTGCRSSLMWSPGVGWEGRPPVPK